MRRASNPPMAKKNIAAAPYMMPMRLWSTVVSQLFQPVVACGRVMPPRGRMVVGPPVVSSSCGACCSTIAITAELLIHRLEEVDELVDLFLGQVEVGHAPDLLAARVWQGRGGHGRLRRRVAQPGLHVAAVELAADLIVLDDAVAVLVDPQVEDAAGEHAAAGEVGEVGGVARHQQLGTVALLGEVVVVDAPGQVAAGALGGEQLGTRGRLPVGRLARRLGLVLQPGVELVGREGDDPLAHVAVGQAAELGALAHVGAGLVGVEPQRVLAPGDGVLLAVEGRDPERVDDVVGMDLQVDVLARGDDQVAAGEHVLIVELAVAVGVVGELPPPLLACDLHGEGVLVAPVDVEQRDEGEEPDHGQHHGRDDGPGDLQLGVAVRLGGQLVVVVVLAAPEPDHQVEGPELDDDEHERRHQEHAVEQLVDATGDRALRVHGVLRGIRGTGGQERHQGQQHDQRAEPAATGHAGSFSGARRAADHRMTSAAGAGGRRPPSASWTCRGPLTAPAMPTAMMATAAAITTPMTKFELMCGRDTTQKAPTTIRAVTITPASTVWSAVRVRKIRDSEMAITPSAMAPASGNSMGFITLFRMRRLVSGSPVAWSAQA